MRNKLVGENPNSWEIMDVALDHKAIATLNERYPSSAKIAASVITRLRVNAKL